MTETVEISILSDEFKRHIENLANTIRKFVSEKVGKDILLKDDNKSRDDFIKMLKYCGGEFRSIGIAKSMTAYYSLGDGTFYVLGSINNISIYNLLHEVGHHFICEMGKSKKGTVFFCNDSNEELLNKEEVTKIIHKFLKGDTPVIFPFEDNPKDGIDYLSLHEQAANYFVKAFLMPRDRLLDAINNNCKLRGDSTSFDASAVARELSVSYIDVECRWNALKAIGMHDLKGV